MASFNTQPPEGGWFRHSIAFDSPCMFQHTAARRRLASTFSVLMTLIKFQHTAARRRLVMMIYQKAVYVRVSTHSRPKAAGQGFFGYAVQIFCFNTQPPEGGWLLTSPNCFPFSCFNTQPPEGGWLGAGQTPLSGRKFQHTAARRRLDKEERVPRLLKLFQHTAARRRLAPKYSPGTVNTSFQHTAARRRLERAILDIQN